ncbi:unnamed protein product [Protopolystoma xenopodis]|uniref:Uncharacterized protein n=1 Tax=Protopolystoma xenopodis TaxID=117903 RepID=A0A3S5AWI2_9PLAT|nr:unnamed protein product [Protopolystoma xenopodis]
MKDQPPDSKVHFFVAKAILQSRMDFGVEGVIVDRDDAEIQEKLHLVSLTSRSK